MRKPRLEKVFDANLNAVHPNAEYAKPRHRPLGLYHFGAVCHSLYKRRSIANSVCTERQFCIHSNKYG